MRLLVLFMLAGLMHISAATYSQTVTIKGENLPLEAVLKAITEQTGYEVGGYGEVLKSASPVTVDAYRMPLEDFLATILRGQPLEARIEDKTIVLLRRPIEKAAQRDSLVTITVQGLVTDSATGQYLVGATVTVLDRQTRTQTDGQGRFTLNAVPRNAKLEISFVGYKAKQTPVYPRVNVSLVQSAESMKEVVVTGLFNRKAESFTGSTATFSQQELLQVGNLNVVKSLANLDPSFRILENLELGSDPNRLPDIQVRGQTGLPDLNNEYGADPNLPLFILDGFETDLQRVVDLDMYLVKSITLLKDAASKAVYGSRAANGVVVIETLRPPAGKLQVTYNYNLNVELPDLSSYSLANARQKLEIEVLTDPRLTNAGSPYYEGAWFYSLEARKEYDQKLEEILRGVDTDWLREPLRNGYGQRHSLTLGGGRDELHYYVELGYNDVQGVMIGSQRKTYSGGIQLAYRRNNVSVSNILRHTYSRGDNSPYGSFQTFAEQNPYLRAREADGSFPFTSPLYNGTVSVQDFGTEKTVINNTDIIWNIRSFLRLNGKLSYSNTSTGSDVFLPAAHNSFPQTGTTDASTILRGSYTQSSGVQNRLNGTLTLSYNQVFGRHAIYANIGGDANSVSTENYSFQVVGFPNANLSFPAAAIQYAPDSRLSGTENLTRDMGFYAAANYAYDDRYLADASWRKLRSSQFGSDNPLADFWSVGIGWNIHNEAFMKQNGFFDALRLTANTGYTGSQPLYAYLGYPVYRYQLDNLYMGEYPLGLTAVTNPSLGAQRKQDHNLSLSAELLDKRLSISADYYVSNTDGLLVDINLPYSTGFSSFKANQGKVENRGIDLKVNYQIFRNTAKGDFVSFYGTMGHNRNTLKELSNTLIALTTSQDAVLSSALKQRFEVGSSLNAIWAVPSRGIDPATGLEVFTKKDGTSTYQWDAADQIVAGDALPKLYGNLGFTVRFRGWQLNTSFAYNWGGQKYNTTLVNKVESIDRTKNVDARVFTSRWQQPGDQTFFKGITDLSPTYPTMRFVEEWDELTLANANLSYDLDRLQAVKRIGFRRLRASLVVDNAFVLSTMRIERGTSYPFARTFSFTLQTNF